MGFPAIIVKYWKLFAGAAVAVGLFLLRAMLIRQGRDEERAAQTERNQSARKEASDARTDALAADDPRGELQRDFSRPDNR